jgi:hypothetical protein
VEGGATWVDFEAVVGNYDYGGEDGLKEAWDKGKRFQSSPPNSRATSWSITTCD